jgi:hypothetical protein
MMVIGEYIVRCPNCLTEVRLVAEMVSPIMIYCQGCERTVILSNNIIFTLPFEYVTELTEKHGVRHCGNVLSTQVSRVARQLINKNKISELHNLLEQRLDVQDFIRKIN